MSPGSTTSGAFGFTTLPLGAVDTRVVAAESAVPELAPPQLTARSPSATRPPAVRNLIEFIASTVEVDGRVLPPATVSGWPELGQIGTTDRYTAVPFRRWRPSGSCSSRTTNASGPR